MQTKEAHAASDARYRASHLEEYNARNARYRATHAEQISTRRKEHRARHYGRIRSREAQYKVEHPEIGYVNTINYKHRKRANGGSFSRASWEYLKAVFGHRCAYCGKRLQKTLTQDHVVPVSKGGWHFSGNIVPACRSCNSAKGNEV